jgi:hypothetical protein
MNKYIDILLNLGLLVPGVRHGSRQYYKLSDKAVLIIKEIPENYNKVLYEFTNKYNISL